MGTKMYIQNFRILAKLTFLPEQRVKFVLICFCLNRRQESKQRQERTSRLLVDVKAGVEHLADKLQHLKAPKGHVPQAQLSPSSDQYILDMLGTCEQKLLKLMEDLGGKDIQDVMKEMEDMEVLWNFLLIVFIYLLKFIFFDICLGVCCLCYAMFNCYAQHTRRVILCSSSQVFSFTKTGYQFCLSLTISCILPISLLVLYFASYQSHVFADYFCPWNRRLCKRWRISD